MNTEMVLMLNDSTAGTPSHLVLANRALLVLRFPLGMPSLLGDRFGHGANAENFAACTRAVASYAPRAEIRGVHFANVERAGGYSCTARKPCSCHN